MWYDKIVSVRYYLVSIIIICVVGIVSFLFTQPNPAAVKSAMKELDFLTGHWEGSGWQMNRKGQKMTFQQTEDVKWKLDGAVLMVEGLGKTTDPESGKEKVVHHALGIISYDLQNGTYLFDAYLANGMSNHTEAKLTDEGSFVWSIQPPHGGTLRYTLRLNEKGQWYEIGEYSRDGTHWNQFMEMILERK